MKTTWIEQSYKATQKKNELKIPIWVEIFSFTRKEICCANPSAKRAYLQYNTKFYFSLSTLNHELIVKK